MSVKTKSTAEFKPPHANPLEKLAESLFRAESKRRGSPLMMKSGTTLTKTAPPKEEPSIPESTELEIDVETQKVRNQYEQLPYPFRNPEEDKKTLLRLPMDDLFFVNDRCYQGRRQFDKPFRILVAGGGTGDALVYLAVQTARLPKSQIVYVDLSQESMKIAKQRLRNQSQRLKLPRMIANTQFLHASLLDVAELGIGTFDYINCSGVLHHLADPLKGLLALKSVLNPGGAMGIMIYGKIGRTSIYTIQDIMRIVNRSENDIEQKIANTRLVLQNLPATNLHRLNGRWLQVQQPVELYDLFLHSRDRAYTIEQLYAWVASAGLHLASFSPVREPLLNSRISPVPLSTRLRNRLERMSEPEQAAVYELIHGSVNTFEFLLSDAPDSRMNPYDEGAIPLFSLLVSKEELISMSAPAKASLPSGLTIHIKMLDKLIGITLKTTPIACSLYRLIDGERPMKEIVAKLRLEYPEKSAEQLWREIYEDLKPAIDADIILFRHVSSGTHRLVYSL